MCHIVALGDSNLEAECEKQGENVVGNLYCWFAPCGLGFVVVVWKLGFLLQCVFPSCFLATKFWVWFKDLQCGMPV